ncbi:uncharacterized protein LOC123698690 [Colias croceus]|uniref:uncharacterized protein LOC123698690 n=1 Tax=Colias crocea TaxID=72248 RepID=UPI001E27DB1E|nr:uncharacterized protein LOC123698690 [Colias croceus]
MWISNYITILYALYIAVDGKRNQNSRQRRYLIFTPSTQYGVFVTVAIPLESESTVTVAWFFEANYYSVDNATYLEPLLGDIETVFTLQSKRDAHPCVQDSSNVIMRCIASQLDCWHGHTGRPCLLRAICENATSHFLHNGILGDLLHLVLTPSLSMSEDDIEDCYYEAEYWGLENKCEYYTEDCPMSPLDYISFIINDNS